MKTHRVITNIVLVAIFMLVFASCSKEKSNGFFRFNKEGGTKEFAVEFDGETISIQNYGEPPKNAYFVEDYDNHDESQWFVELDWCRVFYAPTKRVVFVSADVNASGVDRTATIKGTYNGLNKTIKIEQSH